MKTDLAESIRNTPEGKEADSILRACVHCGFCTATCPTYQLLGDELDSPRGRIYLIKEVLEGKAVTSKTQLHLDRCLTCRSCESTCPSGVRYGRLVDIGRNIVDKHVARPVADIAMRNALNVVLPRQSVFKPLLKIGQALRPALPAALRRKVPTTDVRNTTWPAPRHARKMVVLDGCVQPVLAPDINAATARVLDKIGVSLIKADAAGCCGAVTFHLNKQNAALDYMRRAFKALWESVVGLLTLLRPSRRSICSVASRISPGGRATRCPGSSSHPTCCPCCTSGTVNAGCRRTRISSCSRASASFRDSFSCASYLYID